MRGGLATVVDDAGQSSGARRRRRRARREAEAAAGLATGAGGALGTNGDGHSNGDQPVAIVEPVDAHPAAAADVAPAPEPPDEVRDLLGSHETTVGHAFLGAAGDRCGISSLERGALRPACLQTA